MSPPRPYGEVPLGCQPLGEVVEGKGLGAHRVAVTVDLVEEVSRLIQSIVTDVDILLLDAFGPPCDGRSQSGSHANTGDIFQTDSENTEVLLSYYSSSYRINGWDRYRQTCRPPVSLLLRKHDHMYLLADLSARVCRSPPLQ